MKVRIVDYQNEPVWNSQQSTVRDVCWNVRILAVFLPSTVVAGRWLLQRNILFFPDQLYILKDRKQETSKKLASKMISQSKMMVRIVSHNVYLAKSYYSYSYFTFFSFSFFDLFSLFCSLLYLLFGHHWHWSNRNC